MWILSASEPPSSTYNGVSIAVVIATLATAIKWGWTIHNSLKQAQQEREATDEKVKKSRRSAHKEIEVLRKETREEQERLLTIKNNELLDLRKIIAELEANQKVFKSQYDLEVIRVGELTRENLALGVENKKMAQTVEELSSKYGQVLEELEHCRRTPTPRRKKPR